MSPYWGSLVVLQIRPGVSVPLWILTGCFRYSLEATYCWYSLSLLSTKQQSDPLISLLFYTDITISMCGFSFCWEFFSSPSTPSLNQAKRQVTDFSFQKCNPQVHNSSCQISFSVSWWVYCGSTQKAEPEKFYNIWHTFNMACELKITACHLPLQVDFIKV